VLYQERSDKADSLTDGISMNVMRREGLIEVLANDEAFAQEGLAGLLWD
jgi:predicted nucleic acid-binding protein